MGVCELHARKEVPLGVKVSDILYLVRADRCDFWCDNNGYFGAA